MTDATTTEDSDPANRLDPLVEESERSHIRALTEDSVPSSADDAASVDDIFDALRQPEQRYVLTYLLRSEGEITITELVDYVLAKTDLSGNEEEFRSRMAVDLTNIHLPALVEIGLIEYNMERQLIRPGRSTAQAVPYLKIALAQQRLLDERD